MENSERDAPWARRPRLFEGTFSWDLDTLHKSIRSFKSDYALQDPRTWPYITPPVLCTSPKPKNRTPLPWGAAYDAYYIGASMDWNEVDFFMEPLRLAVEPTPELHKRFIYYPYNFARDGAPRDYVGIPTEEFELWMNSVNGPDWAKGQQEAGAKALAAKVKALALHSQTMAPPTTPEPVMSHADTEKAMMLKILSLQDELFRSEIHCHQEFLRAESAEKELEAWKRSCHRESERAMEAKKANSRLMAQVRELKRIGPAKEVSDELVSTKIELVAAQRESARAKKKLEGIWALIDGAQRSIAELIMGDKGRAETQFMDC